jgi:hypothetical protein
MLGIGPGARVLAPGRKQRRHRRGERIPVSFVLSAPWRSCHRIPRASRSPSQVVPTATRKTRVADRASSAAFAISAPKQAIGYTACSGLRGHSAIRRRLRR